MEAGSFLTLQHDRTDLLAGLEKQTLPGNFALAPVDEKSPKGQDAETYPRWVKQYLFGEWVRRITQKEDQDEPLLISGLLYGPDELPNCTPFSFPKLGVG